MEGYQLEYEDELVKLEEELGNNVEEEGNEEENLADLQKSTVSDTMGESTGDIISAQNGKESLLNSSGDVILVEENGKDSMTNGNVDGKTIISTVNGKENGNGDSEKRTSLNGEENLEKVNSEERLTTM